MNKMWPSKFSILCDGVSSMFKLPMKRGAITAHACLVDLEQLSEALSPWGVRGPTPKTEFLTPALPLPLANAGLWQVIYTLCARLSSAVKNRCNRGIYLIKR